MGIVVLYFKWHYLETPRAILRAWRNFLWFGLYFFSVPILLRTFFSHWRRYITVYSGRGFDVGGQLRVFVENLISRFLGAVMRSLVLAIAFLFEIGVLLGGIAALALWLILPLLLLLGFAYPFI